ncbi:hypothetical protein FIBSPDRAFT_880496 [Athelia psychrophila]|uniref:Uncharacterized protein n=1 Tax=Athelia psychrophila TaxID=1759441 RepID=A0A167SSU9_9AGAM|nr:hypothetical protein FIBSPDRAFT_880496 [Fibularhizoctonia sp. CBS 109695]
MGNQKSVPHSFFVVYFGVPHTPSCGKFNHPCHISDGPSGKDAALPRLHRRNNNHAGFRYPHVHKYYNGMRVWVDGWGKVSLVERNLDVFDLRYYTCVNGRGTVVGWIRVPAEATRMRARGQEPTKLRSHPSSAF